jgi:hypothetical protein
MIDLSKFMCFFGFHDWHYKYTSKFFGFSRISPNFRTCSKCGTVHVKFHLDCRWIQYDKSSAEYRD